MLYRDRRRLHHAVLDDAVALEPTERPWSAQSAFNDRFTRIETQRRRVQRRSESAPSTCQRSDRSGFGSWTKPGRRNVACSPTRWRFTPTRCGPLQP